MIKTADGGYIMERADKEEELKKCIDQLENALDNVQIAMNILREHYGLEVISAGVLCDEHTVQVRCGIDEIGQVLGRKAKLTTEWRAKKEFVYRWVRFLQMAEENSMNFLPLNYRGKALYKLDD